MRISPEQMGVEAELVPKIIIFGDLTGWSEGTTTSPYTKDQGYDVLVGGVNTSPGPFPKIITSYDQHPNLRVTVNHAGLVSTAAGKYQALYATWIECVKRYGFKGRFTPEAQDLFFIKKITERGALPHLRAGNWDKAILACNREWASFAGSPYNQNPHTMEAMLIQIEKLGGKVK
jgi:muramidase (phage lysozyme)